MTLTTIWKLCSETMKKNYKPSKDESDRGVKRYIERKIQDDEAEKQIRDYEEHPDDYDEQIPDNIR